MNTDPTEGLDLAGCRIEFLRFRRFAALGVEIPGRVPGELPRRTAIAVDTGHGTLLPSLYRVPVDGTLAEALQRRWSVSGRGSQDGDADANALSAFGITDSGRTRDGLRTGDIAVELAQVLEAAHPHLVGVGRVALVDILQRRLLREGLHEIVDALGEDRILIEDARMRDATSFLYGNASVMRLSSHRATCIAGAMRAYPRLSRSFAAAWRTAKEFGTPYETATGFLAAWGMTPDRAALAIRRIGEGAEGPPISPLAISVLSKVPRDWIPQGEAAGEWRAVSRLGPALANAASTTGQSIGNLTEHANGRWHAFAARIADAIGADLSTRMELGSNGESYAAIADAVLDLDDMAKDMRVTLAAPLSALIRGREPNADDLLTGELIKGLLFRGRGLLRILEESHRWHRAGGIRVAGAETGSRAWSPVLPGFSHAGARIVPLASKADLSAEGGKGTDADGIGGLHHCVATRWSECMSGRSRIMGVRSASDGSRLSTLEIRFDRDFTPSIAEHRGIRNEPPPPEAMAAVDAYMTALGDRTTRFDTAPLARQRTRYRSADLRELCGYDWADEDRLAEAIAAWSPYIARPYRDLSPADLVEAVTGRALDRPAQGVRP